jgi:hypothetical protein
MRLTLLLAVAVIATGCETKLPTEMSYTELNQLKQKMVQRCVEQGVKSIEMQACYDQESRREISQRISNRAALADFGEGMSRAADNYNRQNRTVSCLSVPSGYAVHTTCQ